MKFMDSRLRFLVSRDPPVDSSRPYRCFFEAPSWLSHATVFRGRLTADYRANSTPKQSPPWFALEGFLLSPFSLTPESARRPFGVSLGTRQIVLNPREETIKMRLLATLAGLAIGVAAPALAQEQKTADPEVRSADPALRQQIEAAILKYE
jgi:hypothetical protein